MKTFTDRESASTALADHIASRLEKKLADSGHALFVASGGKSPVLCFQALSTRKLNWDRVLVTLSDERCVPANHPESNQKLVRDFLIKDQAADARFIAPDDAGLGRYLPATCTLLGMGEDGHFASLFPDSTQLEKGLLETCQTVQVETPSSELQRISMTLTTLLNSQDITLLVFGEKKKQVLEESNGLPVHELLKSAEITIFWAP